MNDSQINEAITLAMETLADVCQSEEASPSDRIAASKVLFEAVDSSYDASRKAALAATALPLLQATVKSLKGDLSPEDSYSPIFELEAHEQATFVLQLAKQIEK